MWMEVWKGLEAVPGLSSTSAKGSKGLTFAIDIIFSFGVFFSS